MNDLSRLARSIVAADLRAAIRAIDAELNAKPPRMPVSYHGVIVNTHARAEAMRKR